MQAKDGFEANSPNKPSRFVIPAIRSQSNETLSLARASYGGIRTTPLNANFLLLSSLIVGASDLVGNKWEGTTSTVHAQSIPGTIHHIDSARSTDPSRSKEQQGQYGSILSKQDDPLEYDQHVATWGI